MKQQLLNRFIKADLKNIADELKIDLPSKITLVKLKEKISQYSYKDIKNALNESKEN